MGSIIVLAPFFNSFY